MRYTLYRKNLSKAGFLILYIGVLAISTFFVAQATAQNVRENLQRVKFEGSSNDKGAVSKGLDLYENYWQQFDVSIDRSAPAYAKYLKLKPNSKQRNFIALYRKIESGGTCAKLGCEISIFENTGDNQWRMILHKFSHDLYVSNLKNNGYYNLHIRSATKKVSDDGGSKLTKLIWNGGKYTVSNTNQSENNK